VLTVIDTY